MHTPPPEFSLIPAELLNEPNRRRVLEMIEELRGQLTKFRAATIIDEVVDQGGVGAHKANLKAAAALGIERSAVRDTLRYHPELLPQFRKRPRKRAQPDVTHSE